MKQAAGLILLLAALAANAGAATRLRFTRSAEMPDSGLRLLLPSSAEADPLPPPATLDGFRESNGQRVRIEMQSPLEVWRWKQREGRWADPRSNRLVLASATMAAPDWQVDWLPREETAKLLAARPVSGRAWGPDELARWLGFFWGTPDLKAEPLVRGRPFGMAEAYLFRRTVPAPGLACGFRLKSGPEVWRFVLLEPGREADPATVEEAFVGDHLPSIQYIGKRAAPSAAFPSGAPVAAGKPLSPREESLKRARESIRNMKGWWAVEGSNTVVLSNFKAGKSQLVDAVLEDLEQLRPVWEAEVSPWEPEREVAVIRVFGTPEEYVRYVGEDKAWTAGLWVPAHRELVVRPLTEGSALRNRQAVLGVIYHEAFHQYLDEAFGRMQAAPWFNEGYAQLFSAVAFVGRRVKVEKDPGALAVLGTMVRANRIDAASLMAMGYEDFYGRDDTIRREHYALAWGLQYFFREGGKKAEPFRGIPGWYAAALRESRDPAGATATALKGVDVKALNDALRQFYR